MSERIVGIFCNPRKSSEIVRSSSETGDENIGRRIGDNNDDEQPNSGKVRRMSVFY